MCIRDRAVTAVAAGGARSPTHERHRARPCCNRQLAHSAGGGAAAARSAISSSRALSPAASRPYVPLNLRLRSFASHHQSHTNPLPLHRALSTATPRLTSICCGYHCVMPSAGATCAAPHRSSVPGASVG
eukprot:7385491-Prymnesium_polylepis.2